MGKKRAVSRSRGAAVSRAASQASREEWQAFGAPWLQRMQNDADAFGEASRLWCERARDRDLANIPIEQRQLYGWHAGKREWVRTDVKL